jgi:LuxR family maltose regulon positive regulatory protein
VAAGAADDAAAHLATARALARQINRGRETVQILALQALLAERSGEDPGAPLTEALSLAEAGGMVRVFADTLPEVIDVIRRRADAGGDTPVTRAYLERVLAAASAPAAATDKPAPAAGSAILTPKESEVLQLVAAGMANKRIATTLGLSPETIKWHMKKLFAKLSAGNRQHAVDRARMLGLLA